VINTFLSYQLITRDLAKSIDRVEAQPVVKRETEYYLANIGKVKSIEEFVKNDRLFKYAMKAHGLEDMAYAKAFMVKALKEGVTNPDSFANKLSDKRYAEFVATFNFAAHGELATTYNKAQHEVPKNLLIQVELNSSQQGYAFIEDETSNFLANIAGVKSIDDLMANSRLLHYAMNAFGLDPNKEPAALVRQMLEGGVSDPESPANKLSDKRFANFVSAFNFVEHGAQTTSREAVQTQTPRAYIQEAGLNLFKGGSTTAHAEAEYFKANIGKVKSVGNLIGDTRLLTFAMAAFGLNARTEPPEKVRDMLLGGVSDPNSPANQLTDKRYAAFVSAFNFVEHGAATTARDEVIEMTPKLYFESSDPENAYFRANIASITSAGDLLRDERLLTYAMEAYGLDAKTVPRELVRDMLLGGLSDPNSPANQSNDKRYAAFVAAFNFAEYGAATTSRVEVIERTPRLHIENTNPETAYFRANIGKVESIDKLLADTRLLTYAMDAYGLDASIENTATIKKMLEGGVTKPDSPANLLADKSYARFVAVFDYVTYGATTTSRPEVLDKTPTGYTKMRELGLVKLPAEYVKAETDYYLANVTKLESIDDLMADKRLLSFAQSAYGFDPAVESPERVREMLEGGVSDQNSPANKLTDKRYAAFVSAFNFMEHGETATTFKGAQQLTVDNYMRQTLEQNAGIENEGVRLALYFERKAPDITSFYEILADPALAKVVRTALGLPDSFASADIDRQVKLFEEKLDIEDFTDPEKLGKFLTRFTSLWEVSNPTSTQQTSLGVLFGQPVEFGVSTNVLLAIQQMKR
jgi:hypothetical protein